MESEVTIRRLREDDWRAFRKLRLDALRTDPLAFGSTLDRESAYTEAKWQDWCRDGANGERSATLVAVSPAGELLGMVGTFSAEGTPHIWGMWTQPEWRNRGIGRRLMDSVLAWIVQNAPERSIILDVNPVQTTAVRIYSALGFQFSGVEEPLGHDPPALVRQMVRRPSSER